MGKDEMFSKFVSEDVTLFLHSGVRFRGILMKVEDGFLLLNDRYSGVKLINTESIENLERTKWSAKNAQ